MVREFVTSAAAQDAFCSDSRCYLSACACFGVTVVRLDFVVAIIRKEVNGQVFYLAVFLLSSSLLKNE